MIADDPIRSQISDEFIRFLVRRHRSQVVPGLRRLWDYYRNDLDFDTRDELRAYHPAQLQGLPSRLTARPTNGSPRETVIENDIAWRIHAMVDFMFGKPPTIQSLAEDRPKAALIEWALNSAFEANGGIAFFQDMALLGAIYGYVDVLVRPARTSANQTSVALEIIEPPRAVPVLDESDYRRLDGYVLHYTQPLNRLERESLLTKLIRRDGAGGRQAAVEVTEIWSPNTVRIWHDGREVDHAINALGAVPVVHIQNLPQPLFYEGLSEVEPLIPLQDELNTRLSDRANRVTLQSFKMYLARGIEGFAQRPVGPGQMWLTDDPNASIESFGGDAASPSEESHINEVREAMDKTSGVSPLAAGVLRNRVGNLTSENALRVTLMGLLAKTQRKRVTYGRGIERICELVLHALHVSGALETSESERRICLHWPSPLPENGEQRLREAQLKLEIGVPRERVLAELGYCGTE